MGEHSETIAAVLLVGLLAAGLWRSGASLQRWHLRRTLARAERRSWPTPAPAPPDPRQRAWRDGYAVGQQAGDRTGHRRGLEEGLSRGHAAGRDSAADHWRAELARLAEQALPFCWPDEHPTGARRPTPSPASCCGRSSDGGGDY